MPTKIKYLLLTCLALFSSKAGAQHLPFINYNTHNGLPQIQVQELFQDSRGYIWIGTKGGLAKFNGSSFEHFLLNEYIYGIAETLSGNLYVITLNNIYKQERGGLKHVAALDEQMQIKAGKDNFWVYNSSQITEYRSDTLYHVLKSNIDIQGRFTSAAYDKKNNRLLFSSSLNKVYELKDRELAELSKYETEVFVSSFSNGNIFYQLLLPKKNYAFINPESKEILLTYKNDNGSIRDVKINKLPVNKHILSDFYTRQFLILDSIGKSVQQIELPFEEEVYPFIIDKDENYWIGTDNGLYQLNNKAFRTFSRDFMNNFWTMIRGKDNNYYGAQYKVGLFRLDLDNRKKQKIAVTDSKLNQEKDFYYGSSADRRGNLYFPTHNGFVKYDYYKAKKYDTGISMISKYDSFNDKIVFGNGYGIGFIGDDEKIETYTDSTKKIITFYPSALEFKTNGDVWIGSRSGLSFFDKVSKRFEPVSDVHYKVYPKQQIISLTKDYKGNLWIGGKSELWLYDNIRDNFTHIGKDFFNRQILSLISPDSTLLLIGTAREIFALRLDDFYRHGKIEFKMFNYRNGFFSEEVAQNGFLLDNDKIFIPSSTTTSVLYYKDISFKPDYFNVYVTAINEIGLDNNEKDHKRPFYVEKGNNRLNISFESVGFGLPTYAVYKYKLEGKDEDWSQWKEADRAHYSGLKSGKYTFRVIAKNGNNLASYQERECAVDIIVKLPFFKEPDFFKYAFFVFFLLTLIVAFLIWITYKNRTAVQSRERQIKLLEVATLQAQINPHFIFNSLSSIQSLISRKMPEIANDYLVKFSRLIRAYMESSIKSSKLLAGSASENENSIKEEIDLLKMYMDLEKMKYPDEKIKYKIEVQDDSLLNRSIPPMILQPFVENAIKHGILPKDGTGTVTVRFEQDNETLICKIVDDGIGRKQSAQNKERSIQANKSRGLQLIVDRVKLLNELNYNIEIDFEDPESGGTVVTIAIQN